MYVEVATVSAPEPFCAGSGRATRQLEAGQEGNIRRLDVQHAAAHLTPRLADILEIKRGMVISFEGRFQRHELDEGTEQTSVSGHQTR